MARFLVGGTLREVKNARLNCNRKDHVEQKGSYDNKTYVKQIRKGNKVFPYASAQWQKKAIKAYAEEVEGLSISKVMSVSTTEALSEGNPYKNYDEDMMGFMIASNEYVTKETFESMDEKYTKGWKKATKGKWEAYCDLVGDEELKKERGYEGNVTVRRRANLMLSTLQAIGHTRLVNEFSTRETDKTPLIYTKEVYAADMSNSFIIDIDRTGVFSASENQAGFRDYTMLGARDKGVELTEEGVIELGKEEKKKRISATLKGIQLLPTRTTMANNLEDMSAKFMIFAEYKIGNSMFNNIFEDNRLKVEYLKEAIEENEEYRLTKIYIGVRSGYFKQEVEEGEYLYLRELLEREFGKDDRVEIGDINTIIEKYLEELEV